MRRLLIATIALLVSSCTMGLPNATPTVAPTLTASSTPLASLTFTPSLAPTLSATFIAQVASPSSTPTQTESPAPTFTPSNTPTGTPRPTDTPLPTFTPLPTETPIPTDTRPPSPTPLPTIGSSPTPRPSNTPVPTATNTPTFTPLPPSLTPSPTETFTPRPTDTPAPTSTFLPTLTPIPSWTPRTLPPLPQIVTASPAAPVGLPTVTLTSLPPTEGVAPLGVRSSTPELIVPTIDATPTFVTAAPGEIAPIGERTVTPVVGDANPIPATPTALPQPVQPTFAPTFLPQPILSNLPDPALRTYALSTGGVPFTFTLPDASTFAQHPLDPNIFVRVDPYGVPFLYDYRAGTQVGAAFDPYTYYPANAETNPGRITQVAWSRDGVYVAYLIDQWSDGQNTHEENDGVWIADGGFLVSGQVFRDCHPDMLRACNVQRDAGPFTYRSLEMAWGANTNHLLLIRIYINDDEQRTAFTLVQSGQNPNAQPPIYRYEYASWSWDGTRILVSGRGGVDGQAAIRWFDPITRTEGQTLFNGSAAGMYISYAVQRPNGQIVALGSTGGAVRLYDVNGTPLSGDIGTSAPIRVEWSPDRSAVLVVTNDGTSDHTYVASVINGGVLEITGNISGSGVVEWINSAP